MIDKINITILVLLMLSCVSHNNKIAIKHHEKCIDDFCLLDSEKIIVNIKNIDRYIYKDGIYLINRERGEYFRMNHYPGDPKYKMSVFEIGYLSDEEVPAFIESDGLFTTDNGTALGNTEENILRLQGEPNHILAIDGCKVYQYKEDVSNSKFVQKNNESAYFIEYWFIDDKLVKLVFGFEYP